MRPFIPAEISKNNTLVPKISAKVMKWFLILNSNQRCGPSALFPAKENFKVYYLFNFEIKLFNVFSKYDPRITTGRTLCVLFSGLTKKTCLYREPLSSGSCGVTVCVGWNSFHTTARTWASKPLWQSSVLPRGRLARRETALVWNGGSAAHRQGRSSRYALDSVCRTEKSWHWRKTVTLCH